VLYDKMKEMKNEFRNKMYFRYMLGNSSLMGSNNIEGYVMDIDDSNYEFMDAELSMILD
jgi:wyosine [tRNA(Phe)-imidazoG37] synthetase (radical SAM superfamily)